MRQPEAPADHRHTRVSHRAAQEAFLNNDLTGVTKVSSWVDHPLLTETHPAPDVRKVPPSLPRGGGMASMWDARELTVHQRFTRETGEQARVDGHGLFVCVQGIRGAGVSI